MTALNSRSGTSPQGLGRTDASDGSTFQWHSFSAPRPENHSTSATIIHMEASEDISDGLALVAMKVRKSPLVFISRSSPAVRFTSV